MTIPNHRTASLSELDMRMVRSVPPGGNWKDIPTSVPSKRLEQIREGFAQGEGSRSTFYGRLRADRPAYTINTLFSRPGNGCHVHPGQDRVISQREAARLQSFPDSFAFAGSQRDVDVQVGNAMPPLLAYQVARALGPPGAFVDLFCGAGGFGLGFRWAGWSPAVANDLQPRYLETYARNVHPEVVLGSIALPEVRGEVVRRALAARERRPGEPLWVVGGPPCQGFSTAGGARSMDDPRNHLVFDYVRVLEDLRPDGFVFENVTGLLSMDGGRVFHEVRRALESAMPHVTTWILSAEEHAVPQRRTRVVLVGRRDVGRSDPPARLTSSDQNGDLFLTLGPLVTVDDAVGDLPPLEPGEDGSALTYVGEPATSYQAFARGLLTAEQYLDRARAGRRSFDG